MEAIRIAIDDETIVIVAFPQRDFIPDKIGPTRLFKFFRSAGFQPSDIAIVSVKRSAKGGTFWARPQLGPIELLKA